MGCRDNLPRKIGRLGGGPLHAVFAHYDGYLGALSRDLLLHSPSPHSVTWSGNVKCVTRVIVGEPNRPTAAMPIASVQFDFFSGKMRRRLLSAGLGDPAPKQQCIVSRCKMRVK